MNDREQNHLDVMTNMVDRCYTPGQYHTTEEQDAEIAAKQVEDEAARRVAANSFKGSKLLIERALGVKL
jgi:hypothetical protein